MLAVYVAAGHASVAEGGLEATDQASRAAEEDRERARIPLGGGQDPLSGEAPVAAAVDEVDMHQAVALGDRPYLLRVRRVRAGGRVEKVDASA